MGVFVAPRSPLATPTAWRRLVMCWSGRSASIAPGRRGDNGRSQHPRSTGRSAPRVARVRRHSTVQTDRVGRQEPCSAAQGCRPSPV